jgi:biopolymer transport protein ExbD
MSHGPEGSAASPNLTPLLDVVMQLLMFFMISVNFVNEQVSGDIKLPVSTSAIPMDKAETDVFFLNVKPYHAEDFKDKDVETREYVNDKFTPDEPIILLVGEKLPRKMIELPGILRDRYRDIEKTNDGKVNTTIIIRAHEKCKYSDVYKILTMCKDAHFKQMKIRAMTKSGTSSGE